MPYTYKKVRICEKVKAISEYNIFAHWLCSSPGLIAADMFNSAFINIIIAVTLQWAENSSAL